MHRLCRGPLWSTRRTIRLGFNREQVLCWLALAFHTYVSSPIWIHDTRKSFGKLLAKYLNNSVVSIPTLFRNDALVASDKGKANLLNSFFCTCFNMSHPPLSNDNQCSVKPTECCEELLCTVEEFEYLLSTQSKSKATGLNGVPGTM